MMNTEYSVYILKCADDTLYIGSTNNLLRRINQHNKTKGGAKYTSARRPVSLVYAESGMNLSDARKKENELKKLTRAQKLSLIKSELQNLIKISLG